MQFKGHKLKCLGTNSRGLEGVSQPGEGRAVAYLSRRLPYPKNNNSAPAAATNEDDLTFQREVAGPGSFVKSPDV